MSVMVALIRPGATVYDEQNRVQGVLDLPLSSRGEDEASRLATELAPLGLTTIYCGPSPNAVQTATIIARAAGLRARPLQELRNLDQGLWQGLQLDEIRRRNLKVYRQWLEDPRTVCPPQGETVEEALERVKTLLRPLLRRHRDQSIGLVVAEPMAQLIASYLRGSQRLQFEDLIRTGHFESIEVPRALERNGHSVF
jgi:broad specificity phosphatase PhoE